MSPKEGGMWVGSRGKDSIMLESFMSLSAENGSAKSKDTRTYH